MAGKSGRAAITLRRIAERGEMFDLFKQVTEKIRREKAAATKIR